VVKKVNPDYVFHLAAQSSVGISWNNSKLTFDVNVNGTVNLLDAIKAVNIQCRILVVGSSDEYGIAKKLPISEEHDLNPQSPYAISKVTYEMISKLYVTAYKMNIVLTRSFNHIGPGQEPIFVVPDWAEQIAKIEKKVNKNEIFVGNIDVKRDFTDVRDIVNAYVMLIKLGTVGEIYNVGSGKAYGLKEILNILLGLTKIDIKIKQDKERLRPSENYIVECDNVKILHEIGWKPSYKIEETLLDVLNYFRNKVGK